MQSDKAAGQKGQLASLGTSLIVVALVMLVAFIVVYLNTPREVTLSWDEGEWSNLLVVNCNTPTIVEFKDKIYMFYSVSTENLSNPADGALLKARGHTDIMYIVFDGISFSSPTQLTPLHDKISVNGSFFVFQDKLYAALSEWQIVNQTTFEAKSCIRLKVFDGNSWVEAQGPLNESEMDNHGAPTYLVCSDNVWIIYQNKDGRGHFINSFSYKTFDGSSWSEARDFTIPTKQPNVWISLFVNGQLWFVWDNLSTYTDSNTQAQLHNEVWLGRFDGENWSNITMLSPSDYVGENCGVTPVKYRDELLVFWSSGYFKSSEPKDGGWLLRRFNLRDGALGELTPVPSEKGYKCSPWSTVVFEAKLYVLWYSDYENWRSMIASFDGAKWSSLYRFDRGYDADGIFIYRDKLWVYGTYESQNPNETGWTYLRSYARTN